MSKREVEVSTSGVEILGYSGRQVKQILPEALRVHKEIVEHRRVLDLNLTALRDDVEKMKRGDGSDDVLNAVIERIEEELK